MKFYKVCEACKGEGGTPSVIAYKQPDGRFANLRPCGRCNGEGRFFVGVITKLSDGILLLDTTQKDE